MRGLPAEGGRAASPSGRAQMGEVGPSPERKAALPALQGSGVFRKANSKTLPVCLPALSQSQGRLLCTTSLSRLHPAPSRERGTEEWGGVPQDAPLGDACSRVGSPEDSGGGVAFPMWELCAVRGGGGRRLLAESSWHVPWAPAVGSRSWAVVPPPGPGRGAHSLWGHLAHGA